MTMVKTKFFQTVSVPTVVIILLLANFCTTAYAKPNYPQPVYPWKQMKQKYQISSPPSPTLRVNKLGDRNDLCLEAGCVKVAASIIDQMDLSVNPCEDFYKFSCGNYEKTHVIPDEKTSLNIFVTLGDELTMKLRQILEEPVSEQEIKVFQQAKELYKTCRNKDIIEKRNDGPLLDLLKRLGGFPVLENNWDERSFYWPETVKGLRREGVYVDTIVDMSVSIDVTDSTRRRIDLDQPAFTLDREFLVNGHEDSNVKAYCEYKRDLAMILGAPADRAQKDMADVVEFEIALAKITAPREDRLNVSLTNNPIAVIDLQDRYPWLYWLDHINSIMPPDVPVGEYEIVNLYDIKYFDQLGDLLARTPSRVIANYLLSRVATGSVSLLTSKLRKRQQEYFKAVYGLSEEDARWKECVEYVQGKLPIALSAMYVRRHFNKDSKSLAQEMVNDLKEVVREDIKTLDWMDAETRKTALIKLDLMIPLIGYPDELDDDQVLTEYYKELEVVKDDYFESDHKIFMFNSDKSYRKLREPVLKDDWRDWATAAVVNAYYNRALNYINFPAGILQGHFFAANRPNYLNYGAIGGVIGHEITHGFDDVGSQFDENGNANNWWAPQTASSFKTKSECLVNQYGAVKDEQTGLNLNGVITLGENIADNGGVQFGYIAYRSYVKRRGKERRLPGLEFFTPEQLFWVAWSQNWCSLYKTESKTVQITKDPHPPGPYRVLLPLKNNKHFANDFKCQVNSPMNPSKKCKVW